MLYDAHTHLPLAPGAEDRIAVVNATSDVDLPDVANFAALNEWVMKSYGFHPWYARKLTPEIKEWFEGLLNSGCTGVGEIGLDRAVDVDFDLQKEVFIWQLDLAARRNLPASIHCVKAWGALWDILRTRPVPECGFLLHAYGGPAEMVRGFLERGAYFSFNGRERRDIFRTLPPERFLIETDNHPNRLPSIYEEAARLRGWTMEQLAAQIEANFQRLFGGLRFVAIAPGVRHALCRTPGAIAN